MANWRRIGAMCAVAAAAWGCRCAAAESASAAPSQRAEERGDTAMQSPAATRDTGEPRDGSGSAADAASPPKPPREEPLEIPFAYRPPRGPKAAYHTPDPQDQARLVLVGARKPGAYPLVVAFHGQPSPTKDPRDYYFAPVVKKTVRHLVDTGAVRPLVLALPVFRFRGANWPGFDPAHFVDTARRILAGRGIRVSQVVMFGHSGAAGCGGGGLNLAAAAHPAAVGFFDTCLGPSWRAAVEKLRAARIPTLHIYSVETAGFRPRQRPEYQATFDFGRALAPLGLAPIACPERTPGPLRDQPFRCAATPDGVLRAFVVDTGEGEAAHQAVLPVAVTYFLDVFCNL